MSITLAQAWDLWREACCAEIDSGEHWWEMPTLDSDGAEHLTFTCRRCPVVIEIHPVDDQIRTPWGAVIPIISGTCQHCGTSFRRPAIAGQIPGYCCPAHKRRAKEKRKASRSPSPRQQRNRQKWRLYYATLACEEQQKPKYDSEEEALRAAAELGRIPPLFPYECPRGGWHLTSLPQEATSVASA